VIDRDLSLPLLAVGFGGFRGSGPVPHPGSGLRRLLSIVGLDQRQVVWILWLLTASGASLGIMIHLMPDALFAAGALLLGMVGMLGLSLARLPGYPLPDLMWLRRRELDAHGPGQACS
jgi:hypothetical protein